MSGLVISTNCYSIPHMITRRCARLQQYVNFINPASLSVAFPFGCSWACHKCGFYFWQLLSKRKQSKTLHHLGCQLGCCMRPDYCHIWMSHSWCVLPLPRCEWETRMSLPGNWKLCLHDGTNHTTGSFHNVHRTARALFEALDEGRP